MRDVWGIWDEANRRWLVDAQDVMHSEHRGLILARLNFWRSVYPAPYEGCEVRVIGEDGWPRAQEGIS